MALLLVLVLAACSRAEDDDPTAVDGSEPLGPTALETVPSTAVTSPPATSPPEPEVTDAVDLTINDDSYPARWEVSVSRVGPTRSG